MKPSKVSTVNWCHRCLVYYGKIDTICVICGLRLMMVKARRDTFKAKTNLSRVPTNALWKELERRSSKEYLKRVRQEYAYKYKVNVRDRVAFNRGARRLGD